MAGRRERAPTRTQAGLAEAVVQATGENRCRIWSGRRSSSSQSLSAPIIRWVPARDPLARRGPDERSVPTFSLYSGTIAHARQAGTRHIVLLSSAAVTFPVPGWIGEQHQNCEQAVTGSGMSWTFVRPSVFIANDLSWAPQLANGGTVRGAYGRAATAPVDERDIAAVAARALRAPQPGTAYELTGPQALSQIERAAKRSAARHASRKCHATTSASSCSTTCRPPPPTSSSTSSPQHRTLRRPSCRSPVSHLGPVPRSLEWGGLFATFRGGAGRVVGPNVEE